MKSPQEIQEIDVGLILDGNGREAAKTGQEPLAGHIQSIETLSDEILPAFYESLNPIVKRLTLYTFSTENWGRENTEVDGLMKLIETDLPKLLPKMHEYGVSIKHAGSRSKMEKIYPHSLESLDHVIAETAHHTERVLYLAIDYGGLAEIQQAHERAMELGDKNIQPYLYIPHDVDLIIRTGGDSRLSNFLTAQSTYAELVFTPTNLPVFMGTEVRKILDNFLVTNRTRGARPK